MPTILLDENIDGYEEYLSRFLFSITWSEFSKSLGVQVATFDKVGLAKGSTDEQIWTFCQQNKLYLITDNRNQDSTDSLETMIRTRNEPTSLPVFTISDISRFRSEREYMEALVNKLLEYLLDAPGINGVGRLYLP